LVGGLRQSEITAAYEEAARAIEAMVIPVGIAWQRALKMQPSCVCTLGIGVIRRQREPIWRRASFMPS
jgi:hypothetical protein